MNDLVPVPTTKLDLVVFRHLLTMRGGSSLYQSNSSLFAVYEVIRRSFTERFGKLYMSRKTSYGGKKAPNAHMIFLKELGDMAFQETELRKIETVRKIKPEYFENWEEMNRFVKTEDIHLTLRSDELDIRIRKTTISQAFLPYLKAMHMREYTDKYGIKRVPDYTSAIVYLETITRIQNNNAMEFDDYIDYTADRLTNTDLDTWLETIKAEQQKKMEEGNGQ